MARSSRSADSIYLFDYEICTGTDWICELDLLVAGVVANDVALAI